MMCAQGFPPLLEVITHVGHDGAARASTAVDFVVRADVEKNDLISRETKHQAREEVLEQLQVRTAAAVVVTVPDPGTARQVVQRVRALAPETYVIVRARYHVHRWQLDVAGAHAVVDEEDRVGVSIAAEVRERLRSSRPHST